MSFVKDNPLLVVLTALASMLLTLWAIRVDPIFNPDALIYLASAEEFLRGNINNGFAIYKWPFYPILIALISTIFGASVETAAYLLNGLLQVIAVIAFLACVKALGGNKRTLIIAAVLILLFPSLNKYRAFVIRDVGFWACYLWSLYHLFIALQTEQRNQLLYSVAFILLAFLFRIEAIAFILIVPLFFLYLRNAESNLGRPKAKLYILIAIIGSLVLFPVVALWIFGANFNASQGSLFATASSSLGLLVDSFKFKINSFRAEYLNEFFSGLAPLLLILSIAATAIYEPLRRLAFIFVYFSWHALKNNLVLQQKNLRSLFYLVCAIHLMIGFLSAVFNEHLVSRHTMALVLTILLLTPFSLEYFLTRWQNRAEQPIGLLKWSFPFVALLFVLLAVDGLDVKTNKLETKEAGRWVADHVEPNSHIYTNDPVLLHYAGKRPGIYNLAFSSSEMGPLLNKKQLFQFDYIVVSVRGDIKLTKLFVEQKLKRPATFKKIFANNRTVLIYDLRDRNSESGFDSNFLKVPVNY